MTGESHYAEMVRWIQAQASAVDGVSCDWIVVRNRLSMLGFANKQLVADSLKELSVPAWLPLVDGFAERVVIVSSFRAV